MEKNNDQLFINRCLQLATQGLGRTYPNPMVGSVIVHQGHIIGEGWHQKAGQAHAEVNAIESVRDKTLLKESTLYVNLEPCSHHGRTPPCADRILREGIPRVVIGCRDRAAHVNGKGIDILRKGGAKVSEGVLEEQARELNRRFFTFHQAKRPYVILKWAQSADGFIDRARVANEKPTPVTDETCRALVHKWRSEEQAILVGYRTAAMDNPRLDVRSWQGPNPLRVLIDRELKIPETNNLYRAEPGLLVFNAQKNGKAGKAELLKIDFKQSVPGQVLQALHTKGVQSLIVEGGTKTIQLFQHEKRWDEARVFTAGKNLGTGVKAPLLEGSLWNEGRVGNSRLSIYRRADYSK